MALVKCPNCGLVVTDEFGDCFGCGYVFPPSAPSAAPAPGTGQGMQTVPDMQGVPPIPPMPGVAEVQGVPPIPPMPPASDFRTGTETGQDAPYPPYPPEMPGTLRQQDLLDPEGREKKKPPVILYVGIAILAVTLIFAIAAIIFILRSARKKEMQEAFVKDQAAVELEPVVIDPPAESDGEEVVEELPAEEVPEEAPVVEEEVQSESTEEQREPGTPSENRPEGETEPEAEAQSQTEGGEAAPETEAEAEPVEETAASNADYSGFISSVEQALDGQLGDGESLTEVNFDGSNLRIYVDLSGGDTGTLSMRDLALVRTSSIADAVLSLENEYDTWDFITIDFGPEGKAVLDKSMVASSGIGKYFDYDESTILK